jgi:uncharacterized RDD family membrane protein YckC
VFYEDRISMATPEGVTLEVTLAGLGSRYAASLLDGLLRGAVLLALALLLVLVGASGALPSGAAGDVGTGVLVAGVLVGLFLVTFGYDVLFETLASGRTPGKRWTGLRVVRTSGAPVGFVTSVVRNLMRLVDMLPAFYAVGIVAVLASKNNQRLGDMAAGTVVVLERRVAPTPAAVAPSATVAAEVATWDVSSVSAEEVATVRQFLQRRATLLPQARERLARELAGRLAPKVVGPSPGQPPESFLEDLVAAKAARSSPPR